MKNTSLVQLAALAPFAATEDQQLSINSAALINGSGQTLRSVSGAAHGTVTLRNGKVVFRPDANFSGIATFDYTLVDSHGVATVQTATVDVAPVADAPALSVTPGDGVGAVNKVGAEFTANRITAGGQFFSTVATFADGGYIISWSDTSYTDGEENAGIRAQLFDANNNKVGAEFRVNTTVAGGQYRSQIATLNSGDFVITWEDEGATGGDTSGDAVRAQMYHRDGSKVGGEFIVNSTTTGNQGDPAITALSNGGFVITWTDDSGLGGDSSSSVKAQLYDAGGHKVGGEFLVNTLTTGDQDEVSVAALAGGGFVATWQDNSQLRGDETRDGSIIAQRFDVNGNKIGGEILVDTKGINYVNDVNSVVGLSNGGFAVTWQAQSNVGDTDDSSIQLQIFDKDGNKVGTELQVNTKGAQYQQAPKITELTNGNLVVVWEDVEDGTGDHGQIKAQVVDGQGHPVGGEFTINGTARGEQHTPAIAALADGSFIVTWTDNSGVGSDKDDDSIRAQIFSVGKAAENTAVKLGLSANLTDTDGSETLAVTVSSIPVGATLTDGTHSFTSSAGNTTVDISTWSFANLTVTPPLNFTGDFKLTVNATSTDHATLTTGAAIDSKTVSQTIDFTVAAPKGAITGETLSGATVAENAANGTVVGTVTATDTLSGAVLTYSLLGNAGGAFAINANTGVITVADGTKLDFETAASQSVQVHVADQTGASLDKTFTIAVTNVNEAPTNETLTGGSVVGSSPNGTVVGTVHGTDPDAGSVLTYSLVDNAGGAFAINANTGVITVADSTKLDFAAGASRAIDVKVTDQGGLSFDKVFNIAVTDPAKEFVAVNEHKASNEDNSLVVSAASLVADSRNPSGTPLSVSSVGNASHGTVSMVNGNITFVPAANFSGIATFDYTLSDTTGRSSTATVTVDVAPVADAPALSASLVSSGPTAVTKVGAEFSANQIKVGGQFFSTVATFADGGYIVSWSDTSYTDGEENAGIRAQLFDASNNKVGGEFRVNTTVAGGQYRSQIAVLNSGDFVITWEDEGATGGDTSGDAVRAQMYHRDGSRVGSEFIVNSTTTGNQGDPSITALSNGGFVITWNDTSGRGGDSSGSVKAQLYDAGGQKVGGEFLVNTLTTGDQDEVSVAALANGGFVAAWQDNSMLRGDETRDGSIIAQRFDVNGNKIGPEILVDTKGINYVNDVNSVVGLSNGGFAVTWQAQSNVGDTDDSSIQFQLFDAGGNKVGAELQVNTKGAEYQQAPKITELTNGFIVVTWEDVEDGDGDHGQIKGQVIDGQGRPVGGEFTINGTSQGEQHTPAIAALSGGRFIVTWTDASGVGGEDDDGIRAQIFSVGGSDPGAPVKLNLSASLTDTDGSETLAVSVSTIPVGATLTDGTHSFTSSAGSTSVDISTWSFANLTVTPPQGFSGDLRLTVNATSTDHATLSTGAATDSKTVSQTLDFIIGQQQQQAVVSQHTTGGTGNDVLFGGSGNDVLTGGGGNDTYQFGRGGGQDRIVNGTATSTAASGELDFGAGVNANQLWFQRNGNDLSIAVMGTHDQVTVAGWFGGAGAQLAEIRSADGLKIDAGVSQLVQAMATFSSTHAGFDPTTATQAPNDTALQNTIATSWHA